MQKHPQPKGPQYRVPYQQCKEHHQKLNYICLDKKCHQNSIICSICKDSKTHEGHFTRPLKFYLEELQQKYQKQENQMDFNRLLDELQLSQYHFHQKLKKNVEQIAEEFRKLQEQVHQRINQLKNQILQEMAKKNRFNQFYSSLKKANIDYSKFLIQNYLPQPSIGKIGNLEKLDEMSSTICSKIKNIKQQIFYRQSGALPNNQDKNQVQSSLDLNKLLKKPINVTFLDGVLSQGSVFGIKSLCLIDYHVKSLNHKIIVKIQQLKKGSQILIGAMTKSVYDIMNQSWNSAILDENCFVFGHDGFSKGWTVKQIQKYGPGSTLQLYTKNGQFKMGQKNRINSGKLPQQQIFIFFAMIGECQIKINQGKY